MAALLIRRQSPGPVFYRQERCGEDGRGVHALQAAHDARGCGRRHGAGLHGEERLRASHASSAPFCGQHNLDELPQLWNVLKGDMSLVGPRPERPHFVEKFKEDIGRYMWRHVSKPGMTGWAQVNGLRGNTSIEERIKYDLYYLENWSLAFDFKILVKTLFARENAY